MIIRILLGLFVAAVGFLMVWKPRYFHEFIGEQAWASKVFSINDQELAYKFIGIIIIAIGFLIATNLVYDLLGWLLSPIIDANKRTGL